MAEHYLVPGQEDGVATDITYSLLTEMTEEAEDFFVDAKDRLLDVTGWATYAGLGSVHFKVADSSGHEVNRHIRRGDHILISTDMQTNLPKIDSFDWFTIDALEYDDYPDENMETFAVRMHPSKQEAGADGNMDDTATIVIERNDMTLSAIYHGRNNTKEIDGNWHGLNETHWADLMKGLLEYFG